MTLTPMTPKNIERIMCERLPAKGEVWSSPDFSVTVLWVGQGWVDYRKTKGRRLQTLTLRRFVELFKPPEVAV